MSKAGVDRNVLGFRSGYRPMHDHPTLVRTSFRVPTPPAPPSPPPQPSTRPLQSSNAR